MEEQTLPVNPHQDFRYLKFLWVKFNLRGEVVHSVVWFNTSQLSCAEAHSAIHILPIWGVVFYNLCPKRRLTDREPLLNAPLSKSKIDDILKERYRHGSKNQAGTTYGHKG
jgi:hypothetical protein